MGGDISVDVRSVEGGIPVDYEASCGDFVGGDYRDRVRACVRSVECMCCM
jgi:hypothetical protein